MMPPLLLTGPISLPRRIPAAQTTLTLIIGLFVLRWLAGIAEHFGPSGLSEYAALIMLAGMGLLFLIHLKVARNSAWVLAGFATLLFASQLSYAANPIPDHGKAQTLMAILCLYAAATLSFFLHIKGHRALNMLRWLFLCFLAGGGLLALVQVQLGYGFVDPARAQLIRAVGSDVHPVSYALQLVLAGVGLIVVTLKLERSFGLLAGMALALGALALYLTFARTAWVMVGLIAFYVVWARGGIASRTIGSLAIGLAALAFAQSDRFDDLGSLPFFLGNFDWHNIVFDHRYIDNSVSWRIVNWGYGLTQALESPWLGVGPGQSALASSFGREMHNIVLEIFLELGIVGLVGLGFVVLGLFNLHRRLPRATPRAAQARALVNGTGLALAAAAFFSTSLVEQLMTVLLYLMVLAAGHATGPEPKQSPG